MSKDDTDQKKKKRRARTVLLLFLQKLRKKCGSFDGIQDWYDFLRSHLDPIVEQYHDVIPENTLKQFEKAHHLAHTGREALHEACHKLQSDVTDVAKLLPKGSPLIKFLILGTAITSGVVAAAVLYINMQTVEIVVKNRGCQSLTPVVSLPITIPGLELFTNSIPDGGQDTIRLLPLPVTINAATPGALSISLLGASLPFEYQSALGARDIIFDGVSLLGKKTALNLRSQDTHEVIIVCK